MNTNEMINTLAIKCEKQYKKRWYSFIVIMIISLGLFVNAAFWFNQYFKYIDREPKTYSDIQVKIYDNNGKEAEVNKETEKKLLINRILLENHLTYLRTYMFAGSFVLAFFSLFMGVFNVNLGILHLVKTRDNLLIFNQ